MVERLVVWLVVLSVAMKVDLKVVVRVLKTEVYLVEPMGYLKDTNLVSTMVVKKVELSVGSLVG
jgi:hypothetical protein